MDITKGAISLIEQYFLFLLNHTSLSLDKIVSRVVHKLSRISLSPPSSKFAPTKLRSIVDLLLINHPCRALDSILDKLDALRHFCLGNARRKFAGLNLQVADN